MAVLKVSNQAQLDSAIKNVRSGDTISLSSGTYNGFTPKDFDFNQKVTITSADASRPATINQFHLRNASNVEFKNLRLDYEPSKSGTTPFWIENSDDISFVNLDIIGHNKGQYGDGIGLRIKSSDDVVLRDSDITGFRNGLYASNSKNLDIIDNDLQGMSNDGMLLAGMNDVLIQGNDFRNMKSPPNQKHKDGIQFMTSKSEPGSQNVVIRDNVIENKEVTHGIFFTNTMFNNGNKNAFHKNILIEDNLVRGNQVHGISMNNGDGVTIRDNVVQKIAGGSNTPLINVSSSSKNVTIQNNDVASVPTAQNGTWKVSGNDTDGRNYLHWYSDGGKEANKAAHKKGGAPEAASSLAIADAASDDAGSSARKVGGGDGETIRIGARHLDKGDVTFQMPDIDFDSGDVIVFRKFGSDVFHDQRGGNQLSVWDDGGSVRINSAIDLQELVQESPDVAAFVKGDDLILEIDHKHGGTAEVVFAGLGDEFRAADHPDLF